MKYSEVYNKTADLVEKGWTQGIMARDKWGTSCYPTSSLAVSWCLSGALTLASEVSN